MNELNDAASAAPILNLPRRRAALSAENSIGTIAAIVVLAISLPIAVFSLTPLVVAACGAVLAMIFFLFWRDDEPPLLLFPLLLQWIAVSVKPYLSTYQGVPLNALADFGGNLDAGALFGLAGISVVALGIRVGLGPTTTNWNLRLRQETAAWPRDKILNISVMMLIIAPVMRTLSVIIGPLRQIFLSFENIEFVGVFCFCYWCFRQNRGFGWLLLIMIYQIVMGFTGFFANFTEPTIILAMAALSARGRPKLGDFVILLSIAAIAISLAAFWSDVKTDYRRYVSQGSNQQVVDVPLRDRINYMKDQVSTFTMARYVNGLNLFLERQSYIDFLSNTMEYVPAALPYEGGKRTIGALVNIAVPRVLFPDKADTDSDSEVTAKYSGVPLTVREGTSISIGYLAELYIDFGIPGALVVCGLGGYAFGRAYRLLRAANGPLLLRFGLCAVFAYSISLFETALVKGLGGAVTVFIGAVLLQRYVLPRLVALVRLYGAPARRTARAGEQAV